MSPARPFQSRHHWTMDTLSQDHLPTIDLDESALSRRRFLRNAALTGGGLVAAAGFASCAPAATSGWTFGPTPPATTGVPAAGSSASPGAPATAAAAPSMS